MNSNLFNSLGLNIDIAYIIICLVLIILIMIVMLILQNKKIKAIKAQIAKFMKGKDAASLEDEIVALCEDNKFIKIETEKNRNTIA